MEVLDITKKSIIVDQKTFKIVEFDMAIYKLKLHPQAVGTVKYICEGEEAYRKWLQDAREHDVERLNYLISGTMVEEVVIFGVPTKIVKFDLEYPGLLSVMIDVFEHFVVYSKDVTVHKVHKAVCKLY